jgi:predicted nucleic acid-binding protein
VIVADATLVAGFLFPRDELHTLANAVRTKDSDWHCPELVFSEIRSVALKHYNKGETLDTIIARCNLVAATVSVYRMHSFGVLQIATEAGLSAYDSEYVALARQLGAWVITTDEQVLRAYPNVATHPNVFIKAAASPQQ